MNLTVVISINVFIAAVNASALINYFLSYLEESQLFDKPRSGLDEALLRFYPTATPLKIPSSALFGCLKSETVGPVALRSHLDEKYAYEVSNFDGLSLRSQDLTINTAFAELVLFADRGVIEDIVIKHVLPFYPILKNHVFNYDDYIQRCGGSVDKDCLATYLREKALFEFNVRLSGLMGLPNDDPKKVFEMEVLFEAAQRSILSKNETVNHAIAVLRSSSSETFSSAHNNCSNFEASSENYFLCVAESLHIQMFNYLSNGQSESDESLNKLTGAILSSAAGHGLVETIREILTFRPQMVSKGIDDVDFFRKAFNQACSSDEMPSAEMLINAEPSIKVDSRSADFPLLQDAPQNNLDDKIFYHLLNFQIDESTGLCSELSDAIDFAIKDNNLAYMEAMLNQFPCCNCFKYAEWTAHAISTGNEAIEEILVKHAPRFLRGRDFDHYEAAVKSRDSERVKNLFNQK